MELEARTLRPGDRDFPEPLTAIASAPQQLRARGDLRPLAPRVAIVGPRKADEYGLAMARELATDLVRAGVTVVSGGAAGVDAAAHEAAVRAGGHTIAVFGTGIDVVFPDSNRRLFARILEGGGALLSQFPDGQRGARWTFPERNRVVSGMSLGVVVVQGEKTSGALITAEHAFAQGRPVMAVPGDARNPLSAGPHDLLRRGAKVAEGSGDVLQAVGLAGQLALGLPAGEPAADGVPEGLDGGLRSLLAALGRMPKHADELARDAGLQAGPALAGLLALEIQGLCEQRPGHYFARRT